jgi:hypothetical protein
MTSAACTKGTALGMCAASKRRSSIPHGRQKGAWGFVGDALVGEERARDIVDLHVRHRAGERGAEESEREQRFRGQGGRVCASPSASQKACSCSSHSHPPPTPG